MLLGPIMAKSWMKKEKNEKAEMSHLFAFFCHNFIWIELQFMFYNKKCIRAKSLFAL